MLFLTFVLICFQNDLSSIRAALSGLVNEFPLCFGYWQRWANHEKTLGNSTEQALQQSKQVIEKALNATPHSHEIWTFAATEYLNSPDFQQNIENVRSFFVRGSEVLCQDGTSSSFFDKYLEFEYTQELQQQQQQQSQVSPYPLTGDECTYKMEREIY